MATEMNVEAERAAPTPPRDYFAWWTSIETDVRKSMLVFAHREPERLHALVRQAYEAGQQSIQAARRAAQSADVEVTLPELPEPDGSSSVPIDESKFTFTEVDAWSKPLVLQYARDAIAADRRARQGQGEPLCTMRSAFDAIDFMAEHNGPGRAHWALGKLKRVEFAAPPLSSEPQAKKGSGE